VCVNRLPSSTVAPSPERRAVSNRTPAFASANTGMIANATHPWRARCSRSSGDAPSCSIGRTTSPTRPASPSPTEGSSSAIAGLLGALGDLKVHDASPTIDGDMPMWFMYEGPEIAPLFGHAEVGAAANRVALSEHTGTHVDAPFHFDADGLTADRVPLDSMLLRPRS